MKRRRTRTPPLRHFVRWPGPGRKLASRGRPPEEKDGPSVRAELARDPVLGARVEFGPRSFEEMPGLYASADVTLITSEREIGGTVLSESLSQGTPVAAFDLPTFRALAAGSDAVRLVTPRSPAALMRAACALFENADPAAQRRRARTHFERHLSFAAIATNRAKIYEETRTRRADPKPH